MRLSFAVLGLLGAGLTGCASSESPPDAESAPARATAEAYDEKGAPWKAPRAASSESQETSPPEAPAPVEEPVARREPPTPPPHVNELFRTPGGGVATPSGSDPQPVQPTPVQTTKPPPAPPKPPPRPSPRPWGGNDPCPPCGMG